MPVFGYDPENRTYDSDPSVPSPLSLGADPIYRKAEQAYGRAGQEQENVAKRFEERRPQAEAETERAYGGLEKALDQPRQPVPQMERVESPPKPEDYHKMSMGYLGAMVLLGAFGGKFIRNAANAPLAAFNGALTGWQEGNMEAYKEKSLEWKEKQQQVLDNNRARLDEYKLILEDHNASIQDQMDRVKLVAAKNQDRLWYDRASVGNYTGIGDLYDKSAEVQNRAQAATDKLVEQWTKTDETATPRANEWKAYLATPQGQQQFDEFTKRDPGAAFRLKGFVDTWADKAAAAPIEPATVGAGTMTAAEAPSATQMPPELRTKYPPPGMNSAERDAWYFEKDKWEKHGRPPTDQERGERHRIQHPGRSIVAMELETERDRRAAAGEPPMTKDEEVAFEAERRYAISAMGAAGGQAGRMATGIAAFKKSLPLASQASTAAGARSKWVAYNQLKQNVALMQSDPAYGNFVIANETAITDYAFAIGRGGGMTVHAQERAARLLNTATSDEAYQSRLRQLEREANAIANAPAEAKAALLHQLFPNAPQEAVAEATSESVLPPAPAPTTAPAAGAGSVIRYDASGNRIK